MNSHNAHLHLLASAKKNEYRSLDEARPRTTLADVAKARKRMVDVAHQPGVDMMGPEIEAAEDAYLRTQTDFMCTLVKKHKGQMRGWDRKLGAHIIRFPQLKFAHAFKEEMLDAFDSMVWKGKGHVYGPDPLGSYSYIKVEDRWS